MIRYLQNNEIDYEKWDDCIDRAFNGNVYAWSWYLDLVCEGWEALVQGDYELVMPLTSGKKYGIYYLYQPPFTQQLGLYSKIPSGNLAVNEFLDSMKIHYRFAEINLNRHNKINHQDFNIKMRKNYELELIKPIAEIRSNYTSNTSRNIRKAENEGISIVTNVDPGSIITMFRQEKGAEIKKLGDKQYQMLEKLIYRSAYKNMAITVGAFDKNNELCAGAFLLKSHHRIVFLFSANNKTARQTGAMHLLIDSVIQQHAGQALTFDFEGSEIPGLARFYAGFGSTETYYPSITYNRLPFPVNSAIRLLQLLRLK
ncbi:MAG: hypothetical protein IH597_07040 [Bacteroidales bacterium]|nr:hypothetical protein [Bacteroidales bacterium]